ncbi:hypothetical protein QL285_054172 [Trifolium repens]|jgi:hypothetical protein|nr:hypothetical protein QL285_054172 [Trifolium repens]
MFRRRRTTARSGTTALLPIVVAIQSSVSRRRPTGADLHSIEFDSLLFFLLLCFAFQLRSTECDGGPLILVKGVFLKDLYRRKKKVSVKVYVDGGD